MAEGTQIGAYRVLRQIGDGRDGSVWLVRAAIADPGATGEIGYTVPFGVQRRHPGAGHAPLIRCCRE